MMVLCEAEIRDWFGMEEPQLQRGLIRVWRGYVEVGDKNREHLRGSSLVRR